MSTDAPVEPGAGPPAPVGLLRIDHVGIAVADLDEAIEFYQRVFGMRCVHTETNQEQGVREAMLVVSGDAAAPGGDVAPPAGDVAPPAGDAAPPGAMVQLLAPLSPTSTIARFLDRSGPGVQQVAYTVADIDATCAALRQRGVRLLYERPRLGTAGSRINFVHPKDAGGVLVELVQPGADFHNRLPGVDTEQ